MNGIRRLLDVIAQLRNPQGGCPWDLEQSHESLMPYFFEEVHEFSDALKAHGPHSEKTVEELADVLYQVVLHTQLLEEKNVTSFDGLSELLAQKLVDRHPHVFDPAFPRFKSSEEVNKAWEKIKAYAKEKQAQRRLGEAAPQPAAPQPAAPQAGRPHQAAPQAAKLQAPAAEQLEAVPRALGALQRAARIGEKAAAFGFDWPNAESVIDKVEEEVAELRAEKDAPDREREELGDLLFALAQYARKRSWNPEEILGSANEKFLGRFRKMEHKVVERGGSLESSSLEEMEAVWQEIKNENLD